MLFKITRINAAQHRVIHDIRIYPCYLWRVHLLICLFVWNDNQGRSCSKCYTLNRKEPLLFNFVLFRHKNNRPLFWPRWWIISHQCLSGEYWCFFYGWMINDSSKTSDESFDRKTLTNSDPQSLEVISNKTRTVSERSLSKYKQGRQVHWICWQVKKCTFSFLPLVVESHFKQNNNCCLWQKIWVLEQNHSLRDVSTRYFDLYHYHILKDSLITVDQKEI